MTRAVTLAGSAQDATAGPLVVVAARPAVASGLVSALTAGGRHAVAVEGTGSAAAPPAPQVVVIDLVDEVGWTVLGELLATDRVAAMPVIALVAPGDVARAIDAGAHDVLVVPPGADGPDAAELLVRVQAASSFAALRAALVDRTDELEAFTQRISHDLKSPLSVIAGMADTLEKLGHRLDDEKRAALLRTIASNATRVARMVNDLLVLAGRGPDAAVERRCDLADVIATAVAEAAVREGDSIVVEGADVTVAVPETEAASIVGNLIDNAVHYGRVDGGPLSLRISGAAEGDRLVLTFADAGPGIPTNAADHVFEPFARLPGSRDINPESSGIGLAIVRRTVRRWGGDVVLDPTAEAGARFLVTLPLA